MRMQTVYSLPPVNFLSITNPIPIFSSDVNIYTEGERGKVEGGRGKEGGKGKGYEVGG